MQLTLEELMKIMTECAGAAEDGAGDGGVADATFEELGYDSIAMLEIVGRIQRDYGTRLGVSDIAELRTPRALIARVDGSAAPRSEGS
jgi:act minimal PKS acyl carrier protein